MNKDIALVLEGGGFRGCYTAGAMKWLYDHDIMFNYTVAISATGIYSFYYLTEMLEELHELSVKGVTDPHMFGISPLLREKAIVGFGYMNEHYVQPHYKKALEFLRNSDRVLEVGMYNMTVQELQYKNKYDFDDKGLLLQASCTLPISGHMTEVEGQKYLDGGIDTMVSVKRAQATGHEKMLVIVTKDKNYVRKPNGFFLSALLRAVYGKYKKMLATLDHRTEAYYDQMGSVYDLEEQGKAILIRPTRDCGVKRFSGSVEQLEEMFQLGWQDMEDRKEDIFRFLEIEKAQ